MLSTFSLDLWETIVKLNVLSGHDWCRLSRCCGQLHSVVSHDHLWMTIFLAEKRPSVKGSVDSWRSEYIQRVISSNNWRQAGHSPILVFAVSCIFKCISSFNTLVVDQKGDGDFKGIEQAIQAAAPGDRVLIKPGHYNEQLLVNKPLELIGCGLVESVVIAGHTSHTLEVNTSGRICNLTLALPNKGQQDMGATVFLSGGEQIILEECIISSAAGHCVAVSGSGTNVKIQHNIIRDARGVGVLLCDQSTGTIEDCNITGNSSAGVCILRDADPTVIRNKIHGGKDSGVLVIEKGKGKVEDNDICNNNKAGVAILNEGSPLVKGNAIHGGLDSGVLVALKGNGRVVDNDIFDNHKAGVAVGESAAPVITGNIISQPVSTAVLIPTNCKGTIRDNFIKNGEVECKDTDAIKRHLVS